MCLQSKEILKWLEAAEGHERLDAESFAAAPVGFTAGCWPVWVTVCGGEANAADFILSMELGRLVRSRPSSLVFRQQPLAPQRHPHVLHACTGLRRRWRVCLRCTDGGAG